MDVNYNYTIEDWWADLQDKYRYDKDGYTFIDFVNKTIAARSDEGKKEIIDFLTQIAIRQERGNGIALAVLEKHCTSDNLDLIFEKAKTLKFNDRELFPYLKVIGHKGTQKHRYLLEEFLLSLKLNYYHTFVQWSTYPNFPDLFVKAYSKYLIETDYKRWTGSGIVQSFMFHPDALELLRDYLVVKNINVWRNFKNDLQTQLTKDFWDKRQKTEIARIISMQENTLPIIWQRWWQKLFRK